MVDKETIQNGLNTSLKSYGKDDEYVVLELVPSYNNYMDYKNFKDTIVKVNNNENKTELIPMNLPFIETKEYKLFKSQIVKLNLDSKENIELTDENIIKFLTRYPYVFEKAINEILNMAVDKGFL